MAPREFRPPEPIGEPFRGDPQAPAPFSDDAQSNWSSTPTVPQGGPPSLGQPPSLAAPETPAQTQPQFQRPEQRQSELSPDQRFARIAVWVGVASIFVFNLVLGPVAIALGISAIRRGERSSGKLTVILGAIGTLVGVVFLVLVAAGVLPNIDQMLKDLQKPR